MFSLLKYPVKNAWPTPDVHVKLPKFCMGGMVSVAESAWASVKNMVLDENMTRMATLIVRKHDTSIFLP